MRCVRSCNFCNEPTAGIVITDNGRPNGTYTEPVTNSRRLGKLSA